ncbi:MAG: lipoyl synthase [Bacteroidales bacterium]|nr:lipoyl synthase [Bacteroidales bacterium]
MKREIDPNKPKIKIPFGKEYIATKSIVHKYKLHTICESGNCPNLSECWSNGTATFMILGNICTRSCKFCSVPTGKPLPPDIEEPNRVADSVKLMRLKHCVLTSVDRDDLPDKGASFWADVINAIRSENPSTTLETLIPDFDAIPELLDIIVNVKPEIVSHNLETVERLTPHIRSRAKYRTSLKTLSYLAERGIKTKSGIMLGLGETQEEIEQVMDDLLSVNCKIITIGQYLQSSSLNIPVQKFYDDAYFDQLKGIALNKGFDFVESGSLIRSSYHAEKHIK